MKPSDEDDKLIQRFYAEDIDPELVEELEAWLRADPEHAKLLAEHGFMEQLMVSVQQEADASAVMQLLLEQEQSAEPIELISDTQPQVGKPHHDQGSLSAHDLAAVGGYALRLALTSKAAKRLYAYAGVAAVLLLAFALFNPWGNNETPTVAPFASDNPNKPAASTESTPRGSTPVATLTASHNAQWAEGALAPGSPLRAGQRLTLTAGLAEIVTADGAVAILEAPATIQLINHNALHLHAGKLVGICETESSKGFVVKTENADITDLGTEFGVEVANNEVTTTVFTGEVALTTPGSKPQPIVANQTAHLTDADGETRLAVKPQIASTFVRQLPASAYGTPIAITNHSFEDGQSGWSGVRSVLETLSSDEFGYAAPDGEIVAFVYGPGDTMSQQLGAVLQPNTTYTLQIEIMHGAGREPLITSMLAIGYGQGGPANGTELARITGGDAGAPRPVSDAPEDRVRTWTLTYTTGTAPAGEGQPLWIQLGADNSPDTGRAGFDNVRLYAKPVNNQAPERN